MALKHRTGLPIFLLRILLLGPLLLFYFILDWLSLRRITRAWVARNLRFLGHSTQSINTKDEIFLGVENNFYAIAANCTYTDLLFVLSPFIWRFDQKATKNFRNLLSVGSLIFVGNVFRLTLAFHLIANGTSWQHAHNLPDKFILSLAIYLGAKSALRRDLKNENINGL